jgi:EAL domain-containing protein (putative c-di-GMP-specific phosphodiesterase class I)
VGQVRALGCPIALDDFGAGYSSFLRLGNMPVDVLKIDGAFVRDMDVEASHKAFVQAMNDMAHAVGKKTVAEFVENDRIRAMVKELGVDFSQGYSLGKPAPVEEWHKC